MSERPYQEIMHCPITHREEEVFFYKKEYQGKEVLVFRGCDHQFNEGNSECKSCCEEAWQKVITKT